MDFFSLKLEEDNVLDYKSPVRRNLTYAYSDAPRKDPPKPASYEPPIQIEDISAISGSANGGKVTHLGPVAQWADSLSCE